MQKFYIESNNLLNAERSFRFVYEDRGLDNIKLISIIDSLSGEEVAIDNIRSNMDPTSFFNILTAYKGSYVRVYIA